MRLIRGLQRLSDAYTLNVGARQEVTINITHEDSPQLTPYLVFIDASERLQKAEGKPPFRFTSVGAQQYTVIVAAAPDSVQDRGSYQVQVSTRACPQPVSLGIPGSRSTAIAGDECVDPNVPSFGTRLRSVDIYSFTADSVPINLTITMRQVSADDTISPEMTLLAPSGGLLVDGFDTIDCTGEDDDRECVQIRVLAVESGAYSLIVGGGFGTGRYTLTVTSPRCKAVELGFLPANGAATCPGQPGPGCVGVWSGDVRTTPCAAPRIEIDGTAPDNGSPADLYTFAGTAGQSVHITLSSSGGDPYLYLLTPIPSVIALASGGLEDAELTATLPVGGTYTIVAANGAFLEPPDAEDEAESEDYVLSIERGE